MESFKKNPVPKPTGLNNFHHFTADWKSVILTKNSHPHFHINQFEEHINCLQMPYSPYRTTIYDFTFILQDSSKHSKRLSQYEFGNSEIFCSSANQITEDASMTDDVKGFFCRFDEIMFSFLPKNYFNDTYTFFQFQSNPIIKVRKELRSHLISILERLLFLYENERAISLIANYLFVLCEELKKELSLLPKKSKDISFQLTESYKNTLVKYIYTTQSTPEYAQILNVSTNYLNKCVKKCLNKTLQDLLNEMLIVEPETLLKYSDLPVAEIAIKPCNQTASNLARFSKSQTGITPKEYLALC
ncbi:MAG: helix-turn-helix domain-containing protein [Arcicella sp.]|nr:helix-turn-helix domain-containing protein [Arcicella sp.]